MKGRVIVEELIENTCHSTKIIECETINLRLSGIKIKLIENNWRGGKERR